MESGKSVCSDCNRGFQTAESLEQHRQAKHSAQPAVAVKPQRKFPKKIVVAAVVLLLVVGGYFVFANKGDVENPVIGGVSGEGGVPADNFDEKAFAARIPKGEIHRHPRVTILIKGKQETIPANVGLAGSVHQPVHTHATDNILHWEVNSPTVENMQLGYFFNRVWRKTFNSQCILDYCNGPSGTLKMYVNEVENTEFDHYMPRDGDEIKIVFE